MKRTFWFLVGAAAALYLGRWLRTKREQYSPEALAARAAAGMRDLGTRARDSMDEGRRAMAAKEADIRASLAEERS